MIEDFARREEFSYFPGRIRQTNNNYFFRSKLDVSLLLVLQVFRLMLFGNSQRQSRFGFQVGLRCRNELNEVRQVQVMWRNCVHLFTCEKPIQRLTVCKKIMGG